MPPLRIAAAVIALASFPALLHAQREKLSMEDLEFVEKTWPQANITSTGIRYVVEKRGSGAPLAPGDIAMVVYTGKLLHGKMFDHFLDRNKPFTFRVGRTEVIDGWDQILQLMRVGDKWTVIIPSELAYGRKGSPPKIPGDSTLLFEMEIVGVKRES